MEFYLASLLGSVLFVISRVFHEPEAINICVMAVEDGVLCGRVEVAHIRTVGLVRVTGPLVRHIVSSHQSTLRFSVILAALDKLPLESPWLRSISLSRWLALL